MTSLDTVVLGCGTHSESLSVSTTEVWTEVPSPRKLTMVLLRNQKTNSGLVGESLNSQTRVRRLPVSTCFSLDPSIAALGVATVSLVDTVLIPVTVDTWHWYSPSSRGDTDRIWRLQSGLDTGWTTEKRLSRVKVTRPLVRMW